MSNTLANDPRWMSQTGTTYPYRSENLRVNVSEDSTYHGPNENSRITYKEPDDSGNPFMSTTIVGKLSSTFAVALPSSTSDITKVALNGEELSYIDSMKPIEYAYTLMEYTWDQLIEAGIHPTEARPSDEVVIAIIINLGSKTYSQEYTLDVSTVDGQVFTGTVYYEAVPLAFRDHPDLAYYPGIEIIHVVQDNVLGFYGFGAGVVETIKINGTPVEFSVREPSQTQYTLEYTVLYDFGSEDFTLEIIYISDGVEKTDSFIIPNS